MPIMAAPAPHGRTNRTRLIIFDCDGVLIDSEIVVCRLASEELTRVGYPITLDQVIERFAGRPEREMMAEITGDRGGRPVPDEYFDRLRRRIEESYRTELRAVPGVPGVLGALRIPACVASSSYPAKLRLGLEATGLYEGLAPSVISASLVAHGKPAPDVFIYAAGWMRIPVTDCVVVEDSVHGVRAAVAAGMDVIGFAGGMHCGPGYGDRLAAAGASSVITHFQELRTAVPEAFMAEGAD
jgi:HAD superfamily hydrolase (TIGR01509 family)